MGDPHQNQGDGDNNIFAAPLNSGFSTISTQFDDELYPGYQYQQHYSEDYCYDDIFNSMPLFQHSFEDQLDNNKAVIEEAPTSNLSTTQMQLSTDNAFISAQVFDPLREMFIPPPPPPLFPTVIESSDPVEAMIVENSWNNNHYETNNNNNNNNPLAMLVANSSSSFDPMVAAPISSYVPEERVVINNMMMSNVSCVDHNESSTKRKKNIIPVDSDSHDDDGGGFRQGVPIVSELDLLQKFTSLVTTQGTLQHMIIRVRCNEDVMALLTSIAKEKKSLLIMGTVGTLSVVEFLQQGKPVTFQGNFIIISLAGIIVFDGDTQIKSEMYVSIGGADGQVFGGLVNGRLLVSTPLQMIGFTFVGDGPNHKTRELKTKKLSIPKMQNKVKTKGGGAQKKGKNKVAEEEEEGGGGGGGGGSVIIKELNEKNENKNIASKGEEGSSNIDEMSLAEFFDAELQLAPDDNNDPYGDLEMLGFFHDLMK